SRGRPPRRGGCYAVPTAPPPASRRPRQRPRSQRARRCRCTSPYLHLLSILAAESTAAVTAECSGLATVPEGCSVRTRERARRHRAGSSPLARDSYTVKGAAISQITLNLGCL